MAEIFVVETRGVGKPDYSKEVSSAVERKGLRLAYKQTLEIFGIVFSAILTGIHTDPPNATIMTDATAHFTANALVGRIIVNITDGSSGIIIANTGNTVTVAALAGGTLNQWSTNDVYAIPSPFAWVTLPLAPGATAHYIDNSTGLPLPFTVPRGYTLSLIAGGAALTEDVIVWVYCDGFLVMSGGVLSGGAFVYENRVIGITTATVDPTGATAHTIDIQITNVGTGLLQGGVDWTGILEAVGTPPLPATKTVHCKWCGHEEDVPRETTYVTCPKCGKLFIVYDLTRMRQTP